MPLWYPNLLWVEPTSGRLLSSGGDSMGRWTHMKFSGKGNRVVTLICTYQVCKKQVSQCGPLTATVQQYSLLSQAQRPEPQRVRQHHAKDLVAFVQSCQGAGELVAVMGDFNDILGEENSGLTSWTRDHGALVQGLWLTTRIYSSLLV